jgi:hypothetical protein
MTSQNIVYERKDILTGTQQVIVDRDLMLQAIGANQDMIALLKDIRRLINHNVPGTQLLPRPDSVIVTNNAPVQIFFMGEGAQKTATKLFIAGSQDFYFDFDRPATINSPLYSYNNMLGTPLIFNDIECTMLSVLVSATGVTAYINSFSAPKSNYIAVRAWAPVKSRGNTDYE